MLARPHPARRPWSVRLDLTALEGRTAPAIFTWTGNGSTNLFSDAANWKGGQVPAIDGTADLVFPAVQSGSPRQLSAVNDLGAVTFSSVQIDDRYALRLARGADTVRIDNSLRLVSATSLPSKLLVTLAVDPSATLKVGDVQPRGNTVRVAGGGLVHSASISANGELEIDDGSKSKNDEQNNLDKAIVIDGEIEVVSRDGEGDDLSVLGTGVGTGSAQFQPDDNVPVVDVRSAGTAALNKFTSVELVDLESTVGGLAGKGVVVLAQGTAQRLVFDGGVTSQFDGRIDGKDGGGTVTGAGVLVRRGTGTTTLNGPVNLGAQASASVVVEGGTLVFNDAAGRANGFPARAQVTGGTLGGTGFLGPVTVSGGALDPGAPAAAGVLKADALTIGAGGTFRAQINGIAAGQADQVQVPVGGSVTLGGALRVAVGGGFSVPPGQQFVLIDNQTKAKVVGEFAGRRRGRRSPTRPARRGSGSATGAGTGTTSSSPRCRSRWSQRRPTNRRWPGRARSGSR
jgi:hypothetical protein